MRFSKWWLLGGLAAGCFLPEATSVSEPPSDATGGDGGDGGKAGSAGSEADAGGAGQGQGGSANQGGSAPSAGSGGEGGSACEDATYRCTDNVLEQCQDASYQEAERCAAGTCDAATGGCEPACQPDGSGCDSGVCLLIGRCEPPLLTVKGSVQHWDTAALSFEKGVEVTATNLLPNSIGESNDSGAYELRSVPPFSLLDLEIYWDDQTSLVGIPTALKTTLFSLRAKVEKESDGYDLKINMPLVPFNWLAQVAVDCGIFPDLATATGENRVPKGIHPFWVQRSSLVVEVRDAETKPVAGLTTDDIEVVLGGFSNKHKADNDSDPFPAQVCFLERSAANASLIVGSKRTTSSDLGRFVMFRMRNSDTEHGTGFGIADLRVSGYAPTSISMLSSGNTGVIVLNPGKYVPPEPRQRSFEGDILPLLANYGCVGCHSRARPNNPLDGAGYAKAKPRGPDQLRADYGGTPDEVYAVLTAKDEGADCTDADPMKSQRICLEAPEKSLLAHKPLKEIGTQDHDTTAFRKPDDADYRAIVEWIEQGALR